jgi:hypothetical protein
MKHNISNLKVVRGEFGDRSSGKLLQIHPLADPPKQFEAVGTAPTRVLRNPESIWIDPDFQRSISNRGKQLIHSMVQQWDWHAFIPPAIYLDERMGVEVAYDGQHTLIGAASRSDITELPMDLHASLEDAVAAAAAFLKRNHSRIGVAPLARFKAAIKAGEQWAITLQRMSKRLGFHIPFYPNVNSKPDTILSVTTMKNLMELRGERGLEVILRALVGNAIAPIREMHLLAIDDLLNTQEYKGLVSAQKLGGVIRGINNHQAVRDAIGEATLRGTTRHQALANLYLREYQGVHGVR